MMPTHRPKPSWRALTRLGAWPFGLRRLWLPSFFRPNVLACIKSDRPIRVLVWQWGRRGAGPRFATLLSEGLQSLQCVDVDLSLSRQAEILQTKSPPNCRLPFSTYRSPLSLIGRLIAAPFELVRLTAQMRRLVPDIGICAMPGPLDLIMVAAIHLSGGRVVVIVHEAGAHSGDGFPLQFWLQRRLCRHADHVAVLSQHVGSKLRQQYGDIKSFIKLSHPPMQFGVGPPEPHDGPIRLLYFGRLRSYKGLDLLAEALLRLGHRRDLTVRVVGFGPETAVLDALRQLPSVEVVNRWVPEDDVGPLLNWADALILPYREASQSGVAAASLAAGRAVIATRVGGLVEQLDGHGGTILCDPTAESIGSAILQLLEDPPGPMPPRDSLSEWRAMAANLLRRVDAELPEVLISTEK